MTTNQEWLFSLTLKEYLEWMESEHSEPNPECSAMLYRMFTENMKHEPCNDYEPKDDVSGYGANFNVAEPNFDNIKAVEMDASRFKAVEMDASRLVHHEPDSREKLEADVRDICWGRNIYRFDAQKRYLKEHGLDTRENIVTTNYEGHVLANVIMHLLDRQAEITREEADAGCNKCFTERHKRERELGEAIDGLTEQVDKLTVERDNLKANNQQLHTLAGEQAAKIDELQSALDDICANLSIIATGEPSVIADIAIETIDALIDECNTANRQCNEYRKKFGKCLDYADAIHALMDDEGLA